MIISFFLSKEVSLGFSADGISRESAYSTFFSGRRSIELKTVVIREGCIRCLDVAQRGFRHLLSSECDSPCGAVFEASLAVKVLT